MSQTYTDILSTDTLSDSRQNILDRDDASRSWFLGASEPTVMMAGQPWIDTTLGLIKVRNSGNTDWVVIGDYATELGHLPLTGGTMTGKITLDGNPTVALHAVPKQYVDLFLPLTGGSLSNYLTLHADPNSAMKAATKQYVDASAGAVVPSGTPMVFVQATAPVGWTQDTSQNDRMLRVVSGAGAGMGGTVSPITLSHDHGNTGNEASHTHNRNNHTHNLAESSATSNKQASGEYIYYNNYDDYLKAGPLATQTGYNSYKIKRFTESGGSGNTGVGTSHSHTIASATIVPYYWNCIVCTKD